MRDRERDSNAAGQIPNVAATSMNENVAQTEVPWVPMLLIILLVPVNGKLSLRI